MRILGLDTSTRACVVAASDGGSLLAAVTVSGTNRPSDRLMAEIERCLQTVGWSASDLDGIVVSAGPGSFTGIRVGVTAAKTLAYALAKPVVAVSSLDVLAANVPAPRWPLWVVVDARKDKVYAAHYEPSEDGLPADAVWRGIPSRQGPEHLIALEQWLPQVTGDVLVLGDALVRYGEPMRAALGDRLHALPAALWVPQGVAVCRLGAQAFAAGQAVPPHALVPHYMHSKESDVTG